MRSRIDEMFPDVTTMSDDELTERVREIRRDRRVNKHKPKVTRASAGAKSKLRDLLGDLTEDQLKEVLGG